MTPGTPVWEGISNNPDRTIAIGFAIGKFVRDGDLIALHGDLGAGKTQFVRGLAKAMGVPAHQVSSPTFVLVHEHVTSSSITLVHIDAYRLHSLADLESIGWTSSDETLQGEFRRGAVIVIEWASKLEGLLGDDALIVRIEHAGASTRRIRVEAIGNWTERANALQAQLSVE
jgi:tRNA threonylcarbamoyladenosine biosynthesis protein TsaE